MFDVETWITFRLKTELPDGRVVSTVGLPACATHFTFCDRDRPDCLLFETCVFPECEITQHRCVEQAQAFHDSLMR